MSTLEGYKFQHLLLIRPTIFLQVLGVVFRQWLKRDDARFAYGAPVLVPGDSADRFVVPGAPLNQPPEYIS